MASEKDPMAPDFVPPPPWPGQQLLKVLKTKKVHEKELHGVRVSTRALEQLTAQEIRDLKMVFDTFDEDGNQKLGCADVRRALKVLGFSVKKDQVEALVRRASSKSRGFVTFNEFLDVVIEQQGDAFDVHGEIMAGFHMFDTEGAGVITLEALRRACRETRCGFSAAETEAMFEEADTNGDGVVDAREFMDIMLRTHLFST